jgi:hypothetical protein
MANFGGKLEETFKSPADPAVVRAHFADLDAVAAATQEVEKTERIGEDTLRFTLLQQKQGPYSFQPVYTVRYLESGDSVVWTTLEGNLRSEGTVRFASAPGGGTEVQFRQEITFDLPVPRLALRLIQPIVDRMMQPGMRAYVREMLRTVPSA